MRRRQIIIRIYSCRDASHASEIQKVRIACVRTAKGTHSMRPKHKRIVLICYMRTHAVCPYMIIPVSAY